MLNYNDIKPGVAVLVEGEPYVCTWNNIMQKQMRRPVNQTKLKHLIKGNSIEYSFQHRQFAKRNRKEARDVYLPRRTQASGCSTRRPTSQLFSFPMK